MQTSPQRPWQRGGTHGGWAANGRAQDLQTGSTERCKERSGPHTSRWWDQRLRACGASHSRPCSAVVGGAGGRGMGISLGRSPRGLQDCGTKAHRSALPCSPSLSGHPPIPTLCSALALNSRSETFAPPRSPSSPCPSGGGGGHRLRSTAAGSDERKPGDGD